MRILFLHGWHSVPGGVKPTYLKDHGHEVINPALDDDDFAAAVRTAQDAFDQHQPQVVVGSSRGGAVAMNISSGTAKLVLLCPAWKNWGTAKTVKPDTMILHSRADDVIPFADSEELVGNSELPSSALITVGNDHRLADPEPLAAMLRACQQADKRRNTSDEPDWSASSNVAERPAWIKEELIQEAMNVYATKYGVPPSREYAISMIISISRLLDATGMLDPNSVINQNRLASPSIPYPDQKPAKPTRSRTESKRSKTTMPARKQQQEQQQPKSVVDSGSTFLADLCKEIQPPESGTLSRTVHNDDQIKVVLFGFAAGEELSEHTASSPAILQFLKGEAEVTLGGEIRPAIEGTWIHMPANLKHSVRTKSPTVMLLILLKGPSSAPV